MLVDVENIVLSHLIRLKAAIADNIIKSGANASGKTISSMNIENSNTSAILKARPFFSTIETGRKSGGMTPVSAILSWIKSKGIEKATKQENKSFAFAIAKTHQLHGSLLYRKGGSVNIYSNEVNNIMKSLQDKINKEINLIIVNYVNRNNK